MTTLYGIVLFLHSYLRWAVLAVAIVVLVRAFGGWRGARAWQRTDDRWHTSFVHLMSLQFVFGVLLYVFLSPITSAFFASPARMKDAVLRFFGLEHAIMMVAAVALAHVGRSRSKKAATPALRHRAVWSWTLGSLVVALVGIPWPFHAAGRPMFRGISAAANVSDSPKTVAVANSDGCPPLYQTRCASCHGENGRGDGVAAQGLRTKPRDFAAGVFVSGSDLEIESVIRDGGLSHKLSPLMPANPDLGPVELKSLVECVRSFQRRAGE